MFSRFSEDAQKALILAKAEMNSLHHPYVGSEHLFLAILSMKTLDITKKLAHYNITYDIFKKELIKIVGMGKEASSWFLYTPLLKRVIETAILNSKEKGEVEVSINELLMAILEEGEGVAIRLLIGLNIDIDEIYDNLSKDFEGTKRVVHKKLLVDDYGVNLNKKVCDNDVDPVIGRDDEINALIEILCRRGKNNPLLIGEAGVGKTALVEELARRIVEGRVPVSLKNKIIISLPMASLVAGTKYRGEFEERISKILKELENNKEIIIFIDEVHTIVGAGGAEGAIDASNIIKPALARGKLQLIGATTVGEYHTFIEKDKALNRRFQLIMVEEPSLAKTKEILKKLKPLYEAYHFVSIDDNIIDLIVELSNTYIYEYYQPDKAIDILDEVCTKASLVENKTDIKISFINSELSKVINLKKKAIMNQDFELASVFKEKEKKLLSERNSLELKLLKRKKPKKITADMVGKVIYLKTKIPVYEVNKNSLKRINLLDKKLNSKVLGQEKVIKDLCSRVKKIQLGFREKPKVQSFLFSGMTGVGKTLLVKEFAKEIYDDSSFIRLDMSEFREDHAVSKIIGSPPGYVGFDNHITILDTIRMHPHAVVLLDEIEKASSVVLKLFLQVLDEGFLTDSRGRKVRFDNVFLFMTTNLGFHSDELGFLDSKKEEESLEEFLGVEFVNRIDKVYYFEKLDRDTIRKIVLMKLNILKKAFKKKELNVKFSTSIVDKVIDMSMFDKFGARRVDKVIDEMVTPLIVDAWYYGKKEVKV